MKERERKKERSSSGEMAREKERMSERSSYEIIADFVI